MSLDNLSPGKLRILKAVASLLEDPAAKVTISRIAGAVHVTEAAIYRHYRSKEEIFTSLVGYMEENLLTPLTDAQQSNAVAGASLELIFNAYMTFFEGHPGLARLFLGHGATEATGIAERIKLLNGKMRAQLAHFFRAGKTAGEMVSGIEPEQAVELFYGMIAGAAMSQTYGFPQISAPQRWAAFSRCVLLNQPKAA